MNPMTPIPEIKYLTELPAGPNTGRRYAPLVAAAHARPGVWVEVGKNDNKGNPSSYLRRTYPELEVAVRNGVAYFRVPAPASK